MKIKLAIIGTVLLVGVLLFKNSPLESSVENKKAQLNEKSNVVSNKTVMQEVVQKTNELKSQISLDEDNELLALEKQLIDKSNEEIEKAIVENNAWAERERFAVLAKEHQLDQVTINKINKYIRLNTVLYKILIDREFEMIEGN